MPTGKRGAVCRECRRTFPSRSHLSKRYLCEKCGEKRALRGRDEMAAKEGELYDRWVAAMRRAVGA